MCESWAADARNADSGSGIEQDVSGAVYELAKQIEQQTAAINALIGAIISDQDDDENGPDTL